MAETTKPVAYVWVDYTCDECAQGVMRPARDYGALLSIPQQYPHRCTNCNHLQKFLVTYPHQRMVEV